MTVNNEFLHSRLISEKERLEHELEQLQASVRPAEERREGSPFGKREEEATEAAELETRLEMEKSIRDQIQSVDHALEKFEAGTYGLCDKCGQPIPQERLEALPQASLCLNCKAGQSKNAKGK